MMNGNRLSTVPEPTAWMHLAPKWESREVLCPAQTAPPIAISPDPRITGLRPTLIASGTNKKFTIPIMRTGSEAMR
jgi:hypothetical protein